MPDRKCVRVDCRKGVAVEGFVYCQKHIDEHLSMLALIGEDKRPDALDSIRVKQ